MNLHLRGKPNHKTLIYVHGTGGTKDTTQSKWIKQYAKDNDLGYLAFDLYGHGKSDLKKDEVLYSRWREQLKEIVLEHVWVKDAIIIGHSMGAGLAMKNAVEEEFQKKVCGVLCQSPAFDYMVKWIYPLLNIAQLEDQKTTGRTEYQTSSNGGIFNIRQDYMDDLKSEFNNFSKKKEIMYDFPITIIHAKNDITIDYDSSEDLMSKLDCPSKKLVPLENSGHSQRDDDAKELVLKEQDDLVKTVDQKTVADQDSHFDDIMDDLGDFSF